MIWLRLVNLHQQIASRRSLSIRSLRSLGDSAASLGMTSGKRGAPKKSAAGGSASADTRPRSKRTLCRSSILPEIVRRVLQHHIHARFAVSILQQILHHRAVLGALL